MKRTTIYRFFSTHSKILIIGGGTGGLSVSAQLLRHGVPSNNIRIIEPSDTHYYQPGWTMVGGDLCSSDLTKRKMGEILPNGFEYRIIYELVMAVGPDED